MKRKRRATQILALVGILCGFYTLPAPTFAQSRLYIAADGNDAWSGTFATANGAKTDGPFATLERARDAIRALKQADRYPARGVVVEVRGGTYVLAQTFKLDKEDSGTERGLVVYRAYKGETVRLAGGKRVGGFSPVTDPAVLKRLAPEAHGHVLQTDLRAQGITEFGKLGPYGMRWPRDGAGPLELFFNTNPMTPARWPNEGFAGIAEVIGKRDEGVFRYDDDRTSRWAAEPEVWLHGYFYNDWSDYRIKVKTIEAGQKIITIEDPQAKYGYRQGQRYYAYNLLGELDQPGEYSLDTSAGILYFWPPSPIEEGEALVSVCGVVVYLKKTEYVVLDHLTIEGGRIDAVLINEGNHNRVLGCTLRNMGQDGVRVREGTDNGVAGCDIYDMGECGIKLEGGDRKTLTPAGHFAENNHIHHFGRRKRTGRPGISLAGVGNRASHNLIHNAPHQGIGSSGNEHLIEFNEIHSVCYETGDAGAFYSGRDWTARGNVIRYNFFHDCAGPGRFGTMGVYLDDMLSGFTVFGNVFYRMTRAMFVGGGRDNIVENNIFVDCEPAVHVDARGLNKKRWGQHAEEGGTLRKRLAEMPYQKPPWSTRYPELVNILNEKYDTPQGTRIMGNISTGGKWDGIRKEARPYIRVENNLVDQDPLFVDAEQMDFRLKPDSPAYRMGFKPIPFEQIGLLKRPDRASWPVEHPIRPATTETPKHRAPVYKVLRTPRRIEVDGRITDGEWDEALADNPMRLRLGPGEEKSEPESRAWLRYDDQALYVAIENEVSSTSPLKKGNSWGPNDAVEIAIRNSAAGKTAPTLVLRGYPSGHFEGSGEAGAPAAAVQRAAQDVEYAVHVPDDTHWNTEWRVPWRSLGIDPKKHRKFAFNLTARKTATRQWVMWCGAGTSWNVDHAGFIDLVQ
ncbi:MAG: right-handed parallel beta-helix repeat-containing protein [Kiritimatiellae bacterium]|nr:right-handed parallel beta-helix repeat-containing protein [Kiritimatiellia bacterium]